MPKDWQLDNVSIQGHFSSIQKHKNIGLKIKQNVYSELPIKMVIFISKNINPTHIPFQSNIDWINDIDWITIDEYSDDEPPLVELPFDTKLSISLVLAISFAVGSFFKAILYCFVFEGDTKQNWSKRPINSLTLTSAFIHHVTHGWLVFWYILALMIEKPMVDLFHPSLCHITQYIGVYGIAYLSIGSLGISIYRVLYMIHEVWVKDVIGERALLIIVWSLSIGISGLITIMFNMGSSSHRFQMNMCKGISGTYAQILMDYQTQQGFPPLPSTYLQMGAIASCLVCQTIELNIYIWFFCYRYKHDNGNISKILTEDVIRSRNKKNIGTFLGQFYGFIMEYSFLFVLFLLTIFDDVENNHTKATLVMIKFVDFGLLSAVDVMTSPSLRALFWRKMSFANVG